MYARSAPRPAASRLQPRQAPIAARPSPRSRCQALVVRAAVVSVNDFKNGMTVEVDAVPYRVVEFLHVKPGKGAAFVRSKLKNCISGSVIEKTFRAGESLNVADIQKREAQYSYAEGDQYVFMDNETYEETRLKKDDWAKYLKEGTTCELLFYNGKVISVAPPQQVELKISDCPPNVKGNTVSGGSKQAVLETGAVVSVPVFLEPGEVIRVDTTTDTYLSRVNN